MNDEQEIERAIGGAVAKCKAELIARIEQCAQLSADVRGYRERSAATIHALDAAITERDSLRAENALLRAQPAEAAPNQDAKDAARWRFYKRRLAADTGVKESFIEANVDRGIKLSLSGPSGTGK